MTSVRPKMVINPFFALFILYFSANLLSLITLALGKPITIEIEEFTFSDATVAISAIALFFSLFASLVVYKATLAVTNTRTYLGIGVQGSFVLALLQLSYLIFNSYYGINIAGVEDEVQGNAILRTFYSVVQPDLVFLILSIGIKSNRWFWLNTGLYGISLLLRSWIGGIYLIVIVVAIRQYPVSLSKANLKYFGVFLSIGIATLPLITSVKWFIRSGAGIDDAIAFLQEFGYLNYLFDSVFYVANRFQHLGHVAILADASRSLNEAYDAGEFIPYWMDAAPQWLFMRLSGVDILTVNKFIVRYVFDSQNLAYATNPGIAGWFFILQYKTVFFCAYLLGITLVPSIFILRYSGLNYFLFVNCFGLIYLFHGWIGAYANMIIYLITLTLFRLLLSKKTAPTNGLIVRRQEI